MAKVKKEATTEKKPTAKKTAARKADAANMPYTPIREDNTNELELDHVLGGTGTARDGDLRKETKTQPQETASKQRKTGTGQTESPIGQWEPGEEVRIPPKPRKPKTEAGREKQMVALAVDLAEKQLRDGSASAQVITHYLKLGTEKEKLERQILKKQEELISEKTKALKAAAQSEELYAKAIAAMKVYGGGD